MGTRKKIFDSIKPPKASKPKYDLLVEEKDTSKNQKAVSVLDEKEKKRFFSFKKKETVEEAVEKKKYTLKHKVAYIVTVVTVLVVLFSIAGVAYAHDAIYKNRVFPGVVVWGEDVGGRTFDEVLQIISDKIREQKIELTGPDQEYEVPLTGIGVIYNAESMALSAYSKGRTSSFFDNYLTRGKLLAASVNWEPLRKVIRGNELEIKPSYTINDEALDKYIGEISENLKIQPQDSKVTIAGGNINIVPAVFGREVDTEELRNKLTSKISESKKSVVQIPVNQVRPNIVDKAAEDVKVQTESVISRPIILKYQGEEYKPSKETVASWISYTKATNATNYTLIVDPTKMKNYFSFLGTKINISPVNKKVRVENGVKETIIQEGKDGLHIDETLLGKEISAQLPVQASVTLTIPTYIWKYKTETERVLVADWDKYIDINISTQTMTAYLKGGEVVGSWKVTTGKSSTPTPIGTWLVVGKSSITRMTGGTRGIDYYDLPNVHWVTWFKGGGYSIHEAYWRSTFGGMDYVWSGSHGCVNAPLTVAKFIYDWAPIGTPVIIHY